MRKNRGLLFRQVLCRIRFEEVLVPVRTEIVGVALIGVGQIGVLIDPEVTNRILNLPLLTLREEDD